MLGKSLCSGENPSGKSLSFCASIFTPDLLDNSVLRIKAYSDETNSVAKSDSSSRKQTAIVQSRPS